MRHLWPSGASFLFLVSGRSFRFREDFRRWEGSQSAVDHLLPLPINAFLGKRTLGT